MIVRNQSHLSLNKKKKLKKVLDKTREINDHENENQMDRESSERVHGRTPSEEI